MADNEPVIPWPNPEEDDVVPEEVSPFGELIDLTTGTVTTKSFRWGKPEDAHSWTCLLVRLYVTNAPRKFVTNTKDHKEALQSIHVALKKKIPEPFWPSITKLKFQDKMNNLVIEHRKTQKAAASMTGKYVLCCVCHVVVTCRFCCFHLHMLQLVHLACMHLVYLTQLIQDSSMSCKTNKGIGLLETVKVICPNLQARTSQILIRSLLSMTTTQHAVR